VSAGLLGDLVANEVDLVSNLIYPDGGLTNPKTGITEKFSLSKVDVKLDQEVMEYFTFD